MLKTAWEVRSPLVILFIGVIVFVAFVRLGMYFYDSIPDERQSIDEKLSTRTINEVPSPEEEPTIGAAAPDCVLYASLGITGNTYNVSIKNASSKTCKNVSFSIYYSEGERYTAASPKPTASDYYWRLGNMASNSERKVTIGTSGPSPETDLCASANNAKDSCLHPGQTTPGPVPTPTPTPPIVGQEYGVWVWDPPTKMDDTKMNQVVASAKNAGFNSIYLTIDEALTADKATFTAALAKFVSKANTQGIAVDAEWGWRDWAKPANRYKAFALIDFVKEYNQSNPKIRNVQSDVEPYLLPEYEGNKGPVLLDFVSFIDEATVRLQGSGIGFSVVIPHFYDSLNKWTPAISYAGQTTYAFDHILKILGRQIGPIVQNNIIIMSYRDTFLGADGVDGVVRQEVSQGGSVKIVVAQETGNVEPSYVTFFGQPRNALIEQIGRIRSEYVGFQGFGGIAVHYIDPYLELR